jgi:hypothetical protein
LEKEVQETPRRLQKKKKEKKNLEEGGPEAAPSESKKLFSHSR